MLNNSEKNITQLMQYNVFIYDVKFYLTSQCIMRIRSVYSFLSVCSTEGFKPLSSLSISVAWWQGGQGASPPSQLISRFQRGAKIGISKKNQLGNKNSSDMKKTPFNLMLSSDTFFHFMSQLHCVRKNLQFKTLHTVFILYPRRPFSTFKFVSSL